MYGIQSSFHYQPPLTGTITFFVVVSSSPLLMLLLLPHSSTWGGRRFRSQSCCSHRPQPFHVLRTGAYNLQRPSTQRRRRRTDTAQRSRNKTGVAEKGLQGSDFKTRNVFGTCEEGRVVKKQREEAEGRSRGKKQREEE